VITGLKLGVNEKSRRYTDGVSRVTEAVKTAFGVSAVHITDLKAGVNESSR
jgi:hypothetical protein